MDAPCVWAVARRLRSARLAQEAEGAGGMKLGGARHCYIL